MGLTAEGALEQLLSDLDGLAHTLAAGDELVGRYASAHGPTRILEAELMEMAAIAHRAKLTIQALLSFGDPEHGGEVTGPTDDQLRIRVIVRELVALAALDAAGQEHQQWARMMERLLSDASEGDDPRLS